MGLPRAFVGFSSTDVGHYRLMQAWKRNKNIDFNFTDCQRTQALRSNDEIYIKRKCRERIKLAGKYILLIGENTRSKHKYVRWEAEVAIEKKCTIIGVNLDGSKSINQSKTPPIIQNIGAVFVPFSAKIIAYALQNYSMQNDKKNYKYNESRYRQLGI